jgi:hypothetical protein
MHSLFTWQRSRQTGIAGFTLLVPHLSLASSEGAAAGPELGLLGYLTATVFGVLTGLGGWLFVRKRSIRARLFTLTAVFGILLAGLATLIYREVQTISELLNDVAERKTPALVEIANAEGGLFDLTLAVERGEDTSASATTTRTHLATAARLLGEGPSPDTEGREIVLKLGQDLDGLLGDLQAYATARSLEAAPEQLATVKARLLERQKTLRADFVHSCEEIKSRVTAEVRSAQALALESEYLVIGLSLLALVIGTAISLVFSANITGVLRRLAEELSDGARQTAAAANQVSCSGQQLASGTSEQAASLEATSASLEQLNATARTNSTSLTTVAELTTRTRGQAERAAAGSRDLAQAMEGLADASREIGKIVKTIDEIAFQTNILALNAAVEAARAGEAGAGFSVVAEEVRALAQRSADAARETATRISSTIDRTQSGIEIGRRLDGDVAALTSGVGEIDQLVGQVLGAVKEESTGLGQIATAVQQMDQVTQGNAASAEEMAAAAEEMSAQAALQAEAVGNLEALISGPRGRAAAAAPAAAPAEKPAEKPSKPAAPARRPAAVALQRPRPAHAPAAAAHAHADFFAQ